MFAGYAFPYIALVVSVITNAVHFSCFKEQVNLVSFVWFSGYALDKSTEFVAKQIAKHNLSINRRI